MQQFNLAQEVLSSFATALLLFILAVCGIYAATRMGYDDSLVDHDIVVDAVDNEQRDS